MTPRASVERILMLLDNMAMSERGWFTMGWNHFSKGQLISKGNCQAKDSSKKRMNEFVFTSMRRVFVHLLEEIKRTSKTRSLLDKTHRKVDVPKCLKITIVMLVCTNSNYHQTRGKEQESNQLFSDLLSPSDQWTL